MSHETRADEPRAEASMSGGRGTDESRGEAPVSAHSRGPNAGLPDWLRPLADKAATITTEDLSQFPPPALGGRQSAVLLLFGETDGVPDILIIERSHDMRSHAGQPAFPGGAVDPTDDGPVGAALREAVEETGLDPRGVDVFGTLPPLWLPPSGFVVTPVLGWWREPSPVSAVDPAEVAAVHRVPLEHLLDPRNRIRVTHPSGYIGPAFRVHDLIVWGFTGRLLDGLFRSLGWERPWDHSRIEELPEHIIALTLRTYSRPPDIEE
jgi:8-oxo-dGTP pyrophosphatase MutT (NUDIX family)